MHNLQWDYPYSYHLEREAWRGVPFKKDKYTMIGVGVKMVPKVKREAVHVSVLANGSLKQQDRAGGNGCCYALPSAVALHWAL